ncbi:eCIS core domain-containing protein [Nostoc sp.]|uniref:eCIS core domain-containing protein n=1 Tax=Nostoc sp. TaxID=1180 RepID=UPI002FF5ACCF
MKALQTKKCLGQKSISNAVIPVQSQIKSHPFVVNSAPQSQELTQTPEKAKLQGFNLAQIPIFPGMRQGMPEMLQPKQAEETLKDLPEVNLAPSSGGQLMPKLVQQKMETSFGTDFSDVRIHEGSQAEKIGAIAYTQGTNIHFRPGKYQPTTQSGQELLGHELAHVQQQRAGRVTAPQSKGVAINADPQLELEADVMGAKAARGESAQVSEAASSGVQRMAAQGDVVQCVRDGKQRAEQLSSKEEDDSAYLVDRAAIDAVLEEYYTNMLDEEISQASPQELTKIVDEKDSLFAPIAVQMLMLSDGQRSSKNPGNGQYIPEDLLDEDKQQGSSGQFNSQDVQQEEDNRPLEEICASIEQLLAELERELPPESELPDSPVLPQQQPLPIPAPTIPAPTIPAPPIPQQRRRPPTPVIPRQEAQRMLAMDNTARAQRIAQLRRQGVGQRVMDEVIRQFEELAHEQDEIARLEGNIPPQGPQQGQQPATRWDRAKARINKPFDDTKESRKQVADGIKQHETYSDQTKILGQDSSKSNVDQVLGQNLPANDQDPNSYLNLPPGETEKFGNDAAVIGMTRDDVKAVGGLLLFHDSFRKFKSAFRDKKKPKRQRIANASDGLGNMTSAVTYTGIVGTQARKGAEHHQAPGDSTSGSGALAAVKQGGAIAGTSIPFDVGKAAASVLTTVPKLIAYTDAGLKAAQRENFGGHKSVGRGVKNIADLTKSAAGAVKDVSSLVQAGGAVGAEGAKIIAGGAVAPAAATVFGTAEAIQGGYKFKKAYKNKKGLAEIGDSPTLDQLDTLDRLKEIQKKKMKRAAINTVLGNVTLAAGVVGFSAGPAGLVAATAMGASVGAFQIGQWGTRKLKQKMRDKGVKGFDPNKTTERKNEDRKELAGNTLTMLEGASNEEKDTLFSSMGLNGSKKDSAVQQVYNDVLARYLSPQELQQPTTTVNRILKLKGNKNNLKQEVSWERLNGNDFPPAFASLVKQAAIDKALKKR